MCLHLHKSRPLCCKRFGYGNHLVIQDDLDASVVLIQKQQQANLVHLIALQEWKRLPHRSRQPLTRDAIKALDIASLARAFAQRLVLSFG